MENKRIIMDLTDGVDRRILNTLLENSRLSYRQIAKKNGISVVTAMNRVKKMEIGGVIKKYSVKLDYEKLDYDIEALIEMKVSKEFRFHADRKLINDPNVFAIYTVTGDFDLMMLTKFKNRKNLNSFLKKLQDMPSVERTNTKFILASSKDESLNI
jgi:DNA-binding Lrp family transcriptional regulator